MSSQWPPLQLEEWITQFRFYTPIQVRFSDTDMIGHINNVSYFSYFEYGRLAYFKELNSLTSLMNPDGKEGTIVTASLECQYLQQAHFDDELLLGIRTSRIGKSSLDIEYALTLPQRKTIAAIGRGTIVHIDPTIGKGKPFSEDVRNAIRTYELIEL
ncbi:acyl-CoA thioesterase [Hazenella sp. IB182357]|uniref:Acyl-CoA thioesterase n=1 Tax=Polycladospora coralii TaxID=2771432 RepID=A0A926N7B0_9BACL|nr:thioesterase family protein [Polycladospora coralii]MBD1370912.1 acyl-CoA thioesterase [Polycladospora coralii]MBS7529851.1 acyl-CoA thioesterase [Polycladospora coralii]